MHDALVVRDGERFGELLRNRQGFIEGDRPLRDAVGERGALDQLHHEKRGRVVLLERVNRGDAGVIERREHLGLAGEARETIGIARKRVGQDLQRDIASERRVTRAIDLAHPAGAQQAADFVDAEAGSAGQ